ncbi:MAG: hypothetical protein QF729_00490 [Candidatus Woesearchaeota archaeon]|jgi:hypothetical protein|nr:hypothetical protein [Candidatus Woesearchaeota archaeon]MDP7322408.1 hypothetical protein [Candidatus Woesearchaeota archaeon]
MAIKHKNSQITIFLIVGVVIILTVAIVFVISRYSIKKTTKQEIINAKEAVFDIQPIKNFVDECLFIVSKEVLKKHFDKNSTQEQLAAFVREDIDACLDFSVFEIQGFNILKKESTIFASINENDVTFRMEYPIIINNPISKEKTEIKDFLVKHEII